jgi:hypothetical protein
MGTRAGGADIATFNEVEQIRHHKRNRVPVSNHKAATVAILQPNQKPNG